MDDYDISYIFNEMQEYLIESMSRNLNRHIKWEQKEGFSWEMWQSLQLEALEDYKRNSKEFVNKGYLSVADKLENLLKKTNSDARLKQESNILKAVQNGYSTKKPTKSISKAFFRVNDRKLRAITKASRNDLKKASKSMLRMANDQYRQVIYKAQVFASTGTVTVNQAIDMATKDFLSKGINCIEYKNGRRVGIDTYAEAVIRNANKKAYLVGEGTKRDEWGVHTVLISQYGACSPTCLPWQGKVYIDDVYSSGTQKDGQGTGYPLLSSAIAGGLFHPNCKHTMTTYFEGVTTMPKKSDVAKTRENSNLVATQRYNERQIRKYKRLENNSLDRDNQSKYKRKRLEWQKRQRELIDKHPEMHRNYKRESLRGVNRVDTSADEIVKLMENNDKIKVIEGKNLVGKSIRRKDEFEYEIEDLINQQGFDGLPQIVKSEEEFYKKVEEDHFIAERTIAKEIEEEIKNYDDMLLNGDFYVKCDTGGFQYGRGMYCAADYSKGSIEYSKFQHEIDQYTWGKEYVKTRWITMDKSAKIIEFKDIQDEYVKEWVKNTYPETKDKVDEYIKIRNDAKELSYKVTSGNATQDEIEKHSKLVKKRDALYEESHYNDGILASNRRIKEDGYDWGILATELGYDAINSSGHGATGSYTVILNRTKLVIFDGNDFVYKKRS